MKALIGGRDIRITADGGIGPETAPIAVAAGADVLVAGSAVFRGGPEAYAANIGAIRAAALGGSLRMPGPASPHGH